MSRPIVPRPGFNTRLLEFRNDHSSEFVCMKCVMERIANLRSELPKPEAQVKTPTAAELLGHVRDAFVSQR